MQLPLKQKIDPAHTALIVVDIQRDFAAPDGKMAQLGRDLSMVEPMISALKTTIDAAKVAGVPVLYAQQMYDRAKLSPLQLEQYDLDGRLATCTADSNGHYFYKIDPPAADTYVKYAFSIFTNADFVARLETLGIKTLVITGMDTIYCVESAIRDAFDRGYKIVVPRDLVACNASNMELHNRTLQLVDKAFGVAVMSADINDIWLNR